MSLVTVVVSNFSVAPNRKPPDYPRGWPGGHYRCVIELYHEGRDEREDGIELRESGVDHGVGLNVVAL
jgi:hypothetical protein